MTEEEKPRKEYGLDEKEMEFQKEGITLFDEKIKTDFESINTDPILFTLGKFEQEHLKNEMKTSESFGQLNEALGEFSDRLEECPHYQNMTIIKLFQEILVRHAHWATSDRQNVLLSKEIMSEVKRVVDEQYTSNKAITIDKDQLLEKAIKIAKEEVVDETVEEIRNSKNSPEEIDGTILEIRGEIGKKKRDLRAPIPAEKIDEWHCVPGDKLIVARFVPQLIKGARSSKKPDSENFGEKKGSEKGVSENSEKTNKNSEKESDSENFGEMRDSENSQNFGEKK